MTSQGASGDVGGIKGRLLLQQCLSARLMVKPETESSPPEFVEIERGLVAYVCFLKGATEEIVEKMVRCIVATRLSEAPDGKRISVLDLPGSLMIIPQATLGGRRKGTMMQYHGNVDKATGEQLYQDLTDRCQQQLEGSAKGQEAGVKVTWGTYGNRQVFKMDTNGPYTHLVEF